MGITMKSRFCLGRLVATPNALDALQRNYVSGFTYIRMHAAGDWGVLSPEDAELNEQSLQDGSRLLSAYLLPDETKIWIITEATIDQVGTREVTTILLPEDY